MRSLYRLIGAETVSEAQKAYYGCALWTILQCLTSGESSFPNWHDLFSSKKPEKEETAEEIKAKILRNLRR